QPKHALEHHQLARGFSVLVVVALGVTPVLQDQLLHRQPGVGRRSRRGWKPAMSQPFGDDAAIPLFGLRSAPRAEPNIPAAEADAGAVRRLGVDESRNVNSRLFHRGGPRKWQLRGQLTPEPTIFQAAPRTTRGYVTSTFVRTYVKWTRLDS